MNIRIVFAVWAQGKVRCAYRLCNIVAVAVVVLVAANIKCQESSSK